MSRTHPTFVRIAFLDVLSANTHTVTHSRETALFERMPPSRRPRCTLVSHTMRFLIGLIALVTVRREGQIVSVDEPRHQPARQFRTVQEGHPLSSAAIPSSRKAPHTGIHPARAAR
jgi:hypothetical protein